MERQTETTERVERATSPWADGEAPIDDQAEALALSSPLLLPYERQLVEEAIQDDCLIITAAGLGWQRVVAVLLRIAQHAQIGESQAAAAAAAHHRPASGDNVPTPATAAGTSAYGSISGAGPAAPTAAPAGGRCVLVLGASPWQRSLIASELARHDPGLAPPLDITNEVPAAERLQLYRARPGGRPLFITPRILVVDLLAKRLTAAEVAGVLVLNAHRASDTSGEGFAVALLRGAGGGAPRGAAGLGSARCWVRAVSDAPTAFNQGFNKVEKVMKALHLRRLHLWPRFQEHVRQCLDEHKPVVVEWDQELSGPMVLIQAALLEVLEGLIKELRRTNNKLDTSELVLENGVLRSFDEIVRRQLDPIWHTVSWKTRRICADLRTLRELSALLLASDAVTFLAHLEGLRQSEGLRCVWLFHDATHAIYEQARRRVYIYRQPGGSADGSAAGGGSSRGGGGGGPAEVEPVLDEPPKWGLLAEVLQEVQRQRRELRALGHTAAAAATDAEADEGAAATAEGEAMDGGSSAAAEVATEVEPRGGSGGGGGGGPGEPSAGEDSAEVEVVDLASSDGEEDGEAAGRNMAGAGGGRGAAAAGRGRGGKRGAGRGGARAAAPANESLRALLADLGLAGVAGAGESGGGPAAEAGGGGGGSSEAGAGADPAACLTPRDLRLLAEAGRGPVLVVARELHSARLLERVVREGGRAVMQQLYQAYLLSKLQAPGAGGGARGSGGGGAEGGSGGRGGRGGGRSAGGRGGRGGGGWKRYRSGAGDPDESGRGPMLRPGEHQALLAEAQRVGAELGAVPSGTRGGGSRGGAKRAKLTHDAAVVAAGGGCAAAGGVAPAGAAATGPAAGRGRGRGQVAATATATGTGTGGGAGSRGRGRGRGAAAGAARRQKKPDDSPVRVAAAAEAEEEEDEDDNVVEAEEEAERDLQQRKRGSFGGASATAACTGGRQGSGAPPVTVNLQGESDEEDFDDAAGARQKQQQQQRGRRRVVARRQAGAGAGAGPGVVPGGGRGGGAAAGAAKGGGGGRGGHGTGAYGFTEDYDEYNDEDYGDDAAVAGGLAAVGAPTAAGTVPVVADGGPGGAGGARPPPPPPPALLRDVQFVSLDSHDEFVLWRVRPSVIIMYEPDLAFLRQVEVYQAERCLAGGCPLWLHTLSYSASLEQQRFRAAVERERETMLRLIQAKQHLVLPAEAPAGGSRALVPGGSSTAGAAGGGGALSADLWLDVYSANALTRAAGGRAAAAGRNGGGGGGGPRRLVVDVREFMSSLPAVLHQKGFELLPVTLEVGDYVLSPQLVVERKSLPDLHASLASGRLYHQAEMMCRHYARPLLLIEFDPDRQFGLQSPSELGDDIDPKNVISKLTLLTLHFPKLRLLWSRSPHATADIFASLKSNQDEPDPAAAALVGVPLGPDGAPLPLGSQPGQQQPGGGPAAALESVVNQPAIELLRRLPGVNDSNYRAILGHVSSLAELAELPLERLEAVMASSKNAKALRDFLDAPCPRI